MGGNSTLSVLLTVRQVRLPVSPGCRHISTIVKLLCIKLFPFLCSSISVALCPNKHILSISQLTELMMLYSFHFGDEVNPKLLCSSLEQRVISWWLELLRTLGIPLLTFT